VRLESALLATRHGSRIGRGVAFRGWPLIGVESGGELIIGRGSVLVSSSEFTDLGVNHPCVIRVLSRTARIVIGEDVGMSGCSICARESVTIGDRCLLGANCIVVDSDLHAVERVPRRYETEGIESVPVVIGNDVFLGANVIVLKGSVIGEGAVVGAGSVVTGVIPPYTVAAGAPARVTRSLRR
jgi:acetyltransferase-like isoleucine patch superfamily enzyme